MPDNKAKNKPQDAIDRMIREFERGYKRNRRVGNRERDMHQEYVNEAFSAGYLDEAELGERVSRIQEAKYEKDLESVVDELPSYAELKGRGMLTEKQEKQAAWLFRFYMKDHPVFGPFITIILGVLIAAVPSTTFASLHLSNTLPFSVIMAVTIILGVITAAFSFFRMLFVVMEDL